MKKEYIIYKLSEEMKNATRIENELFKKFDVKRGLRNEDGTGVLVGLTKIPFQAVVAQDGSGDYATIQSAVDAAPENRREPMY